MADEGDKKGAKKKGARRDEYIPSICPPQKFGIVEPGVYRCKATIYELNFGYLQQLKLKTVVRLSSDMPTKTVATFFKENGIEMIHLGLKSLQNGRRSETSNITFHSEEEIVKEGLEIVLNVDRHPVLLMCSSGVHETGTLVGCLRRLQNYNLTYILEECQSYGSTRYVNDQFIELFDVDMVSLPLRLPSWFLLHLNNQSSSSSSSSSSSASSSSPVAAASSPSPSPSPSSEEQHRRLIASDPGEPITIKALDGIITINHTTNSLT